MSNKRTARFIPLKRVVADYMLEAELPAAMEFRIWNLAVRGMTKVGMDLFIEPVTRKLDVNANLTVDLPQDYTDWVKVGVLNNNGEIATLKLNNQLSSNGSLGFDRLSHNVDASNGPFSSDEGAFGYRNLVWGEQYFQFFGAPSGTTNLGEFKVDEDNGQILLAPGYTYDYVILEYLPSPESNEEFLIPEKASECILAWLAWRDIINKPSSRRVNNQEKMIRKQEFKSQRIQLRRTLNPFRIPVANDIIRQGMSLSLKA